MRRKAVAVLIAGVLFLIVAGYALANPRDYVGIVSLELNNQMKNMFVMLTNLFKDNQDLVDFFTGWATGNQHGTGWVFVDNDGSNYILTNRHVAEQAEWLDFTLEDENGSTRSFKKCPILYVDKDIDLAVAQFPNQENVFQKSFALNMDKQPDGKQVFSAGYPGLLSEGSSWQLAPGAITNFQARVPEFIDPQISTTIQHSAPIDHGSSGGPLLLAKDNSPLGFEVVGVNTAIARANTFLAIPSKAIRMVLNSAKAAKTIRASPQQLTSQLEKDSMTLADELATETPEVERLMNYVSYAFVGTDNLGVKCFSYRLAALSGEQDREKLAQEFT
jgi:S1-C subfamily serine protease